MGLEILENKTAVFILIFTAFALSFHNKRLHSEIYIKEKKVFFSFDISLVCTIFVA
jgi:hypothetical protein